MTRLDLPVKFVEGLRVTDAATMEVAKMVLVGKVNKEIVSLINSKGAPAVGLCGDDGGLLLARPLVKRGQDGALIDLGLVGEVRQVNTALSQSLGSRLRASGGVCRSRPDGGELQHQR